MRSRLRLVLLTAALLSLATGAAGCATKPTMRLNHAEISGARIAFPPSLSVLMTVYLDVYNPNSYDVAIRAVRGRTIILNRYEVPVDYRADGNGLWLYADKTTHIRVPVSVPADVAIAILRESMSQPMIPYRFIGRADVTATSTFEIEEDDYSVNESGLVSRKMIQDVLGVNL